MPQRPIIVFDVNETLLDLDSLHPTFDRVFHDPAALRLWFAHLITYSEALTLSHPALSSTIVGTSSPDHLRGNVAIAAKGPLPADLYQRARDALQLAHQ